MTGDCHVRFYESQGLQYPWPLTKNKHKRVARGKSARKKYLVDTNANGKKKYG